MEIKVDVVVTGVTVYPDRARVRCQGDCEVEPGSHRLLVGELPLGLTPDSVRAAGEGTARVRLVSVDVVRQHYVETPAEKVQALKVQILALEDELRLIADKAAGWADQKKYLDGLRGATEEFAKGLSRGRTTIEDQTRLLAFLQEQDEAGRTAVRELDQQKREIDKQLNKLRRELKEIRSAQPRQRYQARVEVEALTAGTFALELSYVVRQAGWQPLYDLRLVEGENGRKLDVTYIAQVTQSTGQDWFNVQLAVSTARPALNQRLPELKPWYLDVYTPPPPRPQKARARGKELVATATMAMDVDAEDGVMAGEMAPGRERAEVVVADVQGSGSGTAVRFVVPGQTDIPSDGSPHKTTIGQFQFDPQLDYLTVPKHTDAVYRRATVVNTSPGPLLAGPASLFVEEQFIGRNRLVYTPPNGEIELLLGVEEGITIERTLTRRDVDKRLLRDNRQVRYGYKIEVKNLLATEAKLEIHDHIPVARHEQIKVKLVQAKPEPTEQSDLHLLEWHLSLAGGAEQVIVYEYLVEYARSLQIVGLLD